MTTATISTKPSTSTAAHERLAFRATVVSERPSRRTIFVPRNQLYYWSRAWQRDERQAVAELEAGEGRQFATGEDAVAWLLADD